MSLGCSISNPSSTDNVSSSTSENLVYPTRDGLNTISSNNTPSSAIEHAIHDFMPPVLIDPVIEVDRVFLPAHITTTVNAVVSVPVKSPMISSFPVSNFPKYISPKKVANDHGNEYIRRLLGSSFLHDSAANMLYMSVADAKASDVVICPL